MTLINLKRTALATSSTAKKFGPSSILLLVGLIVLLCGEGYFGFRLHALSADQEQIKEDYSMSNNITFGLFSIDQWRDRISEVVNGQVHDFKMTPAQKKDLQAQVETELHGLVNKAVAQFNKPQKSIGGKLKKLAFNAMVNIDDIQAQVPSFARTIINKVNSPASTKRLKHIVTTKLDTLEKQTYDSTSVANAGVTKYVYAKYQATNPIDFNKRINNQLTTIRVTTYHYAYAMLGCTLLALGLWWLMRKQVQLQTPVFILSLLFAGILLVVGITTSIIEVDARIQTFNFMLLGKKVAFENQVLFFQSKSIVGIIRVLISQPRPDTVVIGSLIALFVVVLPIVRLTAKGIYVSGSKNKVIKYLALDSAKWDMADVMVVGILMTYIGLNGILKSQLSNLNIHNGFLTATTVNNTSLQPGYIIFVGYVLYTFALSTIFKRINLNDAL